MKSCVKVHKGQTLYDPYTAGFDWASGGLLRGHVTARGVASLIQRNRDDLFFQGASAALKSLLDVQEGRLLIDLPAHVKDRLTNS